MNAMVERIDDLGKPAWIALMVLAFILFFPLGLAMLAFLIWSGRMGCRSYSHSYAGGACGAEGWSEGRKAHIERKIASLQEKLSRWGQSSQWNRSPPGFAPTGNVAFDEYRNATLKRLEDEAQEFQDFLKRLRAARDKEEFDAYMAKRREGGPQPDQPAQPNG